MWEVAGMHGHSNQEQAPISGSALLLVIKIESKQYFFPYYHVEEQARRVFARLFIPPHNLL